MNKVKSKKNANAICYMLTKCQNTQKIVKNVNIKEQTFHMFWTT